MNKIDFKEKYQNISEQTIDKQFLLACQAGDLAEVRYALLEAHADIGFHMNSALRHAIQSGSVELVDYLLNSKEIKKNIPIYTQSELALSWSANKNHLDLVKYFMTHYNDVFDNEVSIKKAINGACQGNSLKVLIYLLESEDIKTRINVENDSFNIIHVCSKGYIEVLDYLVSKGADIYVEDNEAFKRTCYMKTHEADNMLQHLISFHNFEVSPALKMWLEGDNEDKKVFEKPLKYLKARELNNKLSHKLDKGLNDNIQKKVIKKI